MNVPYTHARRSWELAHIDELISHDPIMLSSLSAPKLFVGRGEAQALLTAMRELRSCVGPRRGGPACAAQLLVGAPACVVMGGAMLHLRHSLLPE